MTPVQPAIDPTVLAMLSIFGGALITVLAGLVGALLRGRGEHRKWLREARMATYVQFLQEADKSRIFMASSPMKGDAEPFRRRIDLVLEAEARLAVLGPDHIYTLAMNVHAEMTKAREQGNMASYFAARGQFVRAVRPIVGIRKAHFKSKRAFKKFEDAHPLKPNTMETDPPPSTVV